MANDYLSLAQMAKPQMMGNAPIGAGLYAGLDYQKQQQRQNGYMDNAAGLAALAAEMDAQKKREYMMAAPGREANIGTENAMSLQQQKDLPMLLEGATEERQAKVEKSRGERVKAQMGQIAEFANMWDAAISDNDRRNIVLDMRDKGLTKLGSKDLAQMPMSEIDETMKRVRRRFTSGDPAHVQKMDLEGMKQQHADAREAMKAEAKLKIADKAERLKRELSKSNVKPQDVLKVIENQLLSEIMAEKDPEKKLAMREELTEWLLKNRRAPQDNRLNAGPQQIDLNPTTGDISARVPQAPPPAPMPSFARPGQPAPGPQRAPSAAPQQAPAAPRDVSQRTPNTYYNTPKGVLKWTGTGWIK